jgi:RNA 2',3'-cyclic 3'-phosphodiesterase
MRAESDCFGFTAPPTDGVFFALFPDAEAAAQLERVAAQQCIRHRLTGRPIAAERLHVSLLGFGAHAGVPGRLVAAAVDAAATVGAAPFEVTFDRALSFLGWPRPRVLCGDNHDLRAFRNALGEAIAHAGLGRVKPQWTPHVTLLYDAQGIEEHAIAPINWTVREFVLVHSLRGEGRYIQLGRWPLKGGDDDAPKRRRHRDDAGVVPMSPG